MQGLLNSDYSNGTIKGALARHACTGGHRLLRGGIGENHQPLSTAEAHIAVNKAQFRIAELLFERLGELKEIVPDFRDDEGVFKVPTLEILSKHMQVSLKASPGLVMKNRGFRSNDEAAKSKHFTLETREFMQVLTEGSYAEALQMRADGIPLEAAISKRKSRAAHGARQHRKPRHTTRATSCHAWCCPRSHAASLRGSAPRARSSSPCTTTWCATIRETGSIRFGRGALAGEWNS